MCKIIEEIEPRKDAKNLEEACRRVSDFLHENYDMHTTVIINGTHIKVVKDIEEISIKR